MNDATMRNSSARASAGVVMNHLLRCLWTNGDCSDLQWLQDAYDYVTGFVSLAVICGMTIWILWDESNSAMLELPHRSDSGAERAERRSRFAAIAGADIDAMR